jgi:hypothetical protein
VSISIQFASSISHGFVVVTQDSCTARCDGYLFSIRPWHHSCLSCDTRDTCAAALFVADSQMRRQLSFFNFKATHYGFIVDWQFIMMAEAWLCRCLTVISVLYEYFSCPLYVGPTGASIVKHLNTGVRLSTTWDFPRSRSVLLYFLLFKTTDRCLSSKHKITHETDLSTVSSIDLFDWFVLFIWLVK